MHQDFEEHFKKLTDYDLIDIIENSHNVSPVALLAAKNELENRNLSDEIITHFKTKIRSGIEKKIESTQRIDDFTEKIKAEVSDIIIPEQNTSTAKIIKIICVWFGIYLIIALKNSFTEIVGLLNSSGEPFFFWQYLSIPTVFLYIILIGDLLLKKKRGWILVTAISIINLVLFAFLLIESADYLLNRSIYFWLGRVSWAGFIFLFFSKRFMVYFSISKDFATKCFLISFLIGIIFFFFLRIAS